MHVFLYIPGVSLLFSIGNIIIIIIFICIIIITIITIIIIICYYYFDLQAAHTRHGILRRRIEYAFPRTTLPPL